MGNKIQNCGTCNNPTPTPQPELVVNGQIIDQVKLENLTINNGVVEVRPATVTVKMDDIK